MSRIYKTWEEIKKAIKLGQRVRVGYYSDGFLGFRSQLGSITEISDNQFIINNSHGFTCGVKALEVEIIDNSDVTNKTWEIKKYQTGQQVPLGSVYMHSIKFADYAIRRVVNKDEAGYDDGYYVWHYFLIENEIKGASEEKPSIDKIIAELEEMNNLTVEILVRERLQRAIEIIKSIK